MIRTILLSITIFLLHALKLDAQTWQSITYSPTGLSSNKVNSVCNDALGNYWIATNDSGITVLKLGQYQNWKSIDRIFGDVSNDGTGYPKSRVLRDGSGSLYFKGFRNNSSNSLIYGLLKYDSSIHSIKNPYDFSIYPLAIDGNGNIWCGTGEYNGQGLVRYSPNGVWQNYTTANSGLYRNEVVDITVDKFNNIWIGYAGSSNLTKYNGINWKLYWDQYPSTSIVKMLKSDINGNVYYHVASTLNKYDVLLDTILRVTNSIGDAPVGIDFNNTVWTTDYDNLTQSAKLYKNDISSNRITYTLNGLNLYVNSMFFENNNKLWLTGSWMFSGIGSAHSNKGLVNVNGNNFTLYTKENSGLLSNRTNQVILGDKVNQLIIAHDYGISFLDTIAKSSRVLHKYNTGLYNDNLEDIFTDSRGNKWILNSSYVQKLAPDNKTWDYYDDDSLLYINFKLKNREDKYGNIWFYDWLGISKISSTGSITNISTDEIFGSGTSYSIRSVSIHPNGEIWVVGSGSTYVIKKYNGTSWSIVSYPFTNSDLNSGIEVDKNSNVWLKSSKYYLSGGIYYQSLIRNKNNLWDTVNTGISISASITELYSDRYGKLWLMLNDSGAACYDGQQWTRYHKGNSNILSNNINDIYVDTFGKVWFSTNLGISVLTPAPATAPNVTTSAATNITTNAAQVSGTIVSNGGLSITAKGICWSITPNPTVNNSKSTEVTQSLTYTSSLSGLSSGTKYYARAYATNAVGTAYGNEISFTTTSLIPGCVNTVLWPTAAVTVPQNAGQTIEITPGNGEFDCNFAGEYSRTEGWKNGLKYTIYSTRVTDFITITEDNNIVIKSGVQPLEFTNSGTSVKRIHVNLNSSCATEDVCRDISVKLNSSTGISNFNLLNDVQLFPNPNQGSMFIEFDGANFKTEKFDVKLYNMLGQEIQMSFELMNVNKIRLTALNDNNGLFLMKLFIGDKEIRKTVQISK
jgi:ligand-binding sensor domain-containing protein